MSRKLLTAVSPVLVLAAFAVMPAVASASTTEYGICETSETEETKPPCAAKEVFATFKSPTKVVGKIAAKTTFALETESAKESIECTALSDKGTSENKAGVGHSTLTLTVNDCEILTGALKGCELKNIEGEIGDEVLTSGVEVKMTISKGFVLETNGKPAGCPDLALGTLTGSVTGRQAAGSSTLAFTKAKGLKLGAEAANLTGQIETATEATKKPVLISPAPESFKGPRWKVEAGILEAGEKTYTAALASTFSISHIGTGKLSVSCTKFSGEGKLKGSGKGKVGTSSEEFELTGCSVEKEGKNLTTEKACEVRSQVEGDTSAWGEIGTATHKVKIESELAWLEADGARSEAALVTHGNEVFGGKHEILVVLEFEGPTGALGKCTGVKEGVGVPVKGRSVAALSKVGLGALKPGEVENTLEVSTLHTYSYERWNPNFAIYENGQPTIEVEGAEAWLYATQEWTLNSLEKFGFENT